MTYVELIVVLGIFGTMSAIVLTNYSTFHDKIDIRNLANEIALKVFQAQKDSSSGKLPPSTNTPFVSNWKPSYGVYFDRSTNDKSKSFVYFTDLYNAGVCDISCETKAGGLDYLEPTIFITKGNYVSKLEVFQTGTSTLTEFNNLSLIFSRSNPGVTFGTYVNSVGSIIPGISYASITISSTSGITSTIKVFSSGRIQIK